MKAVSISMGDARRWAALAWQGDTEAAAFFRGLFAGDDPCWLCDAPAGDGRSVSTLADPAAPGMAILMVICGACYGLPPPKRLKKEMRAIRAMWPSSRWNGWR